MVVVGIALLVLGAALLVAEAHLPTYGALGIAGAIALVAGGAIAVDASGGGVVLVAAVVAVLTLLSVGMVIAAVRATKSVARGRARTGAEALVGHVGVVRAVPAPVGQVLVDGALWNARTGVFEDDPLHEGDRVVVERVHGLTLSVRRAEEWELEA